MDKPRSPGRRVFHQELMAEIERFNVKNPTAQRMTFRRAVTKGLVDDEGKTLADSFTTKIRAGMYYPPLDRLRNLAAFLGTKPVVFTLYRERLCEELVESGDEPFGRFVQQLAAQSSEVREILLDFASKKIGEVLDKAREVNVPIS